MKKIVDAGTYKAMGQNVPIAFRGKSDKHNFNRRANAGRYIDSNYGSGMEDLYAIMEKYRIKGFEFGNWVTQQERADYVASLVTTLEELYSVLGSRNIGIDKNIGIAFGARGSRGAKAHYEPCLNMINLTRAHGAGSLAHEYGHALDYNLGGFLDQHKMYNALSGGHETSATLEDNVGGQLRALVNQIIDSIANGKNMQKMAALNRDMMAKSGKVVYSSYWFRRTEIFARFFEQYVCYCLYERHISNRLLHKNWAYYLAEIVYVEKDDFMKIKPVADKLMKEAAGFLNGVKGHRLRATAYPKPVIEKPVRKLYVQTSTKVVENKKVAAETKPATGKNVIDKLEVRRQAIKLGVIEGQGQSVHFTAKLKDLVELYHGHKQEVLNIVCDMWADDTIRRRGGGIVEHYKEEAIKEARRVLASRKSTASPKPVTGKKKEPTEAKPKKTPAIKPLGGFVLTKTGKLCTDEKTVSKWGSDNLKTWKRIYVVRLYDDDKTASIYGHFVICLKNGQYYFGDMWGQAAIELDKTVPDHWETYIHPAGSKKPVVRRVGLNYSDYSFRDQNEAVYFAEHTHKRKVQRYTQGVDSKAFHMLLKDIYEFEYMFAKYPSRRGTKAMFWKNEKPQKVDTKVKS